jgi:hypothetical protein
MPVKFDGKKTHRIKLDHTTNFFYNFRLLKKKMKEGWCPNYDSCRLVQNQGFTGDETQRISYLSAYCQAGQTRWETCKRYIVKNLLHFCPDFVMPDTVLTPDEIIDKFDIEYSDKT